MALCLIKLSLWNINTDNNINNIYWTNQFFVKLLKIPWCNQCNHSRCISFLIKFPLFWRNHWSWGQGVNNSIESWTEGTFFVCSVVGCHSWWHPLKTIIVDRNEKLIRWDGSVFGIPFVFFFMVTLVAGVGSEVTWPFSQSFKWFNLIIGFLWSFSQ